MKTRTRTIASFFSVAMAAMLLGALVTQEIRRPETALARDAVPVASVTLPAPGQGAPFGLDTFREIARQTNPGVVNINTSKTVKRQRNRDPFREFFGDDMMDRFFGPQGRGRGGERQTSLGSGFVIDKEGYVLTNRHVVDDADEINVTLSTQRPGDTPYRAKLVGKDSRTDVALLKIEPKDALTPIPMGDSDRTEAGDWVMAIGNPFGLGGNSVTVGVVSYKGRPLNLGPVVGTQVEMIQTDASINPGNSGGPLLNTRGEVIGINTMIVTGGLGQSAGVGFAVPINVAREILQQLRETGKVVRGWLGVQILPVTDEVAKTYGMKDSRGAAVVDINPDSPADKAGLKAEDVVIGVDGRKVEDNSDLSRYVASKAPGTTVKLLVLRGGVEKTIAVALGTFPEDGPAEQAQAEARGALGMTLRDLTPDLSDHLELPRGSRGAVVTEVEPGEAAESAGLRQGDVIVSVNGNRVDGVGSFDEQIEALKDEGIARLRVRRGNGYLFVILRFK
ncbi:MAG: DegQ family serine endoprotease [Vicinamibacteria bacterium]